MKTLARSKDRDVRPNYMDMKISPIESDNFYQRAGLCIHYFKNVTLSI